MPGRVVIGRSSVRQAPSASFGGVRTRVVVVFGVHPLEPRVWAKKKYTTSALQTVPVQSEPHVEHADVQILVGALPICVVVRHYLRVPPRLVTPEIGRRTASLARWIHHQTIPMGNIAVAHKLRPGFCVDKGVTDLSDS